MLAFSYTLWAITGAGADTWLKGFLLLVLAGIPVYVLMVWWRGRDDRQDVIPEPSAQAQVE